MWYKVNKVTIWRYSEDIQWLKEYVIRSPPEPIYKWEYIEYKMNADSNGRLYVPVWWLNWSGSYGVYYNWKVSVDGWSETSYSWTWAYNTNIILSWYTSWTSHTIKIVPNSEDYWWARAFWWTGNSYSSYLTEVIYDSSYMWYADSATSAWDYFRANQYNGCTNLIASPEEYMPDTVTSIGTRFRQYQFYNCTSLTKIKWWYDSSIWGNYYRYYQYNSCTSNKTIKVLSNVWYASYTTDTLDNTYVTSVSVPSDYLNNFKSSTDVPRLYIDDSKFIWY